ncbi:spermidine synthase [Arcobacter vandammei]|uniref:spermine/spermidine synthase domain-containing protein n=1 Tax=Arcobacter vandammei TaxID=2782243 RepID=UPI0018E03BA8|nr:spermidine synthase [Arcobacter vandammei]
MKSSKAFAEMIVHIPLCTHIEAKKVLILGTVCESIKNETLRHKKESNFEFGDLSLIETKKDKEIDVVILTDIKADLKGLANIYRVLKDDAIVCFTTTSFSQDSEELKKDLKLFGDKFWIVMPFSFGHTTCILASRKYHPTADLNLQRADFLDNLEYYSADIHNASFVFPAHIHKELTGIAKR